MDNLKINISEEKIYIKKGFMKKKYLYCWYIFLIIIIIFMLFLDKNKESILFKYLDLLFQYFNFGIVINIILILSFLGSGFLGFHFFLAMYLEKIIVSEKITIFTPNYEVVFDFKLLKEIKVNPFYGYSSLRSKNASFRGSFRDRSTIKFITKDGKEYEWGYSLSYQKGMEIKRILEERIKEKEV
ncbi:MAG: hypothetical protein Q4A58_01645 [Fusobacterium sp.]|uniref:hypothetical protein n=1 Tax=Fusobacterium sp. TaxID=68766 RepID=UPI0026DB5C7F|nr:hypothetical protein [Fusobacterium sp.]MDO4689988.1 hypothetical protein [Fusobacterium sp.]